MLSYRHSFHAGNHADVLKHFVLVQICRHLNRKEAPYWFIDTHAGAGRYALDSGHATKLAEFAGGIGRLWQRTDLPPALADYVALVKGLNPGGNLKHYPGSPWLAWKCLRPQDRLRLFELHSTDSKLLQDTFKAAGRQAAVSAADGLAGLKALLPPPPRRALVLIDPSYETRGDYAQVVKALQDGLRRFATGTYAVWYPQLVKSEARQLPDKLKALPAKSWLDVRLTVARPAKDGFGMFGSGMFVVNPPWTLEATLREALPTLCDLLAADDGARYEVEGFEA